MGIQEFISDVCVQTAVYWEPGANDGFGNKTWSIGVEISCRWDEIISIITNNQGKTKILSFFFNCFG